MKLLAIAFAAWAAGFLAYVFGGQLLWGQTIRGADLSASLFASMVGAMAALLVNIPVMFKVRSAVVAGAPAGLYPLAGVATGVVPVFLVTMLFGGGLRDAILSPEAHLFFLLFGVFGLVFSIGFASVFGVPGSEDR